jgi:pyruvate,orthophosphate dikinase
MGEPSLAVLRAIRLKLVASPEAVAVGTGMDEAAASAALEELGAAGLAAQTPRGWRLTADGQTALQSLLEQERASVDTPTAQRAHERFTLLDAQIKQIVTDHQMSGAPSVSAADVKRLVDVHRSAGDVFDVAVAMAPRLVHYGPRLERAITQLESGDARFFAHPMLDSYHTVWFEFHEELIHLAGLTRAQLNETGHDA